MSYIETEDHIKWNCNFIKQDDTTITMQFSNSVAFHQLRTGNQRTYSIHLSNGHIYNVNVPGVEVGSNSQLIFTKIN